MSARELYSSIVAAVDRLLEKKYGPYADMEKVLEERFELREQVLNYLSANPLASKVFACKGRRLVDNGLLKMLLDRGYTNRVIAAFFNVTTGIKMAYKVAKFVLSQHSLMLQHILFHVTGLKLPV